VAEEVVRKDDVYALMGRIESFRDRCRAVRAEIGKVIVGNEEVVEGVLVALLAGGHVLLEGVPGTGKTLLVKTFARALDLSFSRIQFTPDLMPADVTGTMILVDRDGRRDFEFSRGPIFSNLVLSDEINRATPKTQSALLEAMQEKRVTILGQTHEIPLPFVVLATQNPIEMEGTYPLPEAQLDRFMLKILMRFPGSGELEAIMERTTAGSEPLPARAATREELAAMGELVRAMKVENRTILAYAAKIVGATHPDAKEATPMVRKYVRYGVSPRGAQALVWTGKVRALMDGRPCVDFADVRAGALACLRHRLILNFEGESSNVSTDAVITEVIEKTAEIDF